jgi:ADP-ribose pyrophosphatase YjhB (NUDIX family)
MVSGRGKGRWTLGLYNSYDPTHFHEAMRRAVSRAAPLCQAFGMDLAPIGFPFHAYRNKAGAGPPKETPVELAKLLADSTTIGEGGEYLVGLATAGRFQAVPFPRQGFPPQLGTPVLATRSADPTKAIGVRDVAYRTREGESFLFVVGLGPRGVPKEVHDAAHHHLELTGGSYSLETATAMGVLAGRLHEALDWADRPNNPPLTADAFVERDGQLLLIRRRIEPFKGAWALPGGFVHPGEIVEEAVTRELLEETGLTGTVGALVGIYSKPGRDPRGPTVGVVYRVHAPSGTPTAGDDAAEVRFWPLSGLPRLAFDHEQIVADALRASGRPGP